MFSSAPTTSRLLTLPAELREAIFELALTSSKTVVTFRLDDFQKDTYEQAVGPPLLKVNRQIRAEALPIYYDCNDFILHTDGNKAEDAHHWLYHTQPYLGRLRCVSIWLRYIPPRRESGTSSGALSVSMRWSPQQERWLVDEEWRWITVVRKPSRVDADGRFLVEKLGEMVNKQPRSMPSESYVAIMSDLRAAYAKWKLSG